MLTVNNLSIQFSRYGKGLMRHPLQPVRDISLSIASGEIVAVVGSSGSGKSLLAHAVLGLLPDNARTSGEIIFEDKHVTSRSARKLRGKNIALIPQSVAYLNPLAKVGRQVHRASQLSGNCCTEASRRTNDAFARYSLKSDVQSMYPFQVSGGMARRVLTATATAGNANLLIADEPTTGLDPTVARQSLLHLRELADAGKAVMLITHDIDAAVNVADKVAVIYAGTTVELASVADFRTPEKLRHPYTASLWNALPQHGFTYLSGNQPAEDSTPGGCIFSNRCEQKTAACDTPQALRPVNSGYVRCCHA